MPRHGGTLTILTSDAGQSYPFSWSPDSEKVAFAGFRDGGWSLWWVSRKTGEQRRLMDNAKLNTYARYPAWSPDDSVIVYEEVETAGNIWMIRVSQ